MKRRAGNDSIQNKDENQVEQKRINFVNRKRFSILILMSLTVWLLMRIAISVEIEKGEQVIDIKFIDLFILF